MQKAQKVLFLLRLQKVHGFIKQMTLIKQKDFKLRYMTIASFIFFL